jgi:hypothetical protein
LLISALALTAAPVMAATVDVSGFAFGTYISDHEWHENEARLAINLDVAHEGFELRSQVTTQENQPRRLTVGYSAAVTDSTSMRVQAGRFVRLDGFYNNVTDAPSSSGMSLLPLGSYSRRMNTGTFTIMDGVQACAMTNTKLGALEYGVRVGQALIDDEGNLQREAFDRVASPHIVSKPALNYDAYSRLYTANGAYLVTYNHYATDFRNATGGAAEDMMLSMLAQSVTYDTIKLGVLRNIGPWELSGEFHRGWVSVENGAGTETFSKRADSYYVKAAYDLADEWVAYGMLSRGKSSTGTKAHNNTIGLTWDNGDWMVNAEYHVGQGNGWAKYESPVEDWNAYAISIVRRF